MKGFTRCLRRSRKLLRAIQGDFNDIRPISFLYAPYKALIRPCEAPKNWILELVPNRHEFVYTFSSKSATFWLVLGSPPGVGPPNKEISLKRGLYALLQHLWSSEWRGFARYLRRSWVF